MFVYPDLDPVAVRFGPIAVHWYGLMYLIGFLSAWGLARYRIITRCPDWTATQVSDLIFYAAIGVIVGGRVGYMLFYDTANWISRPLLLFKVWQGGMSFHGGLIGVLIAIWLFARLNQKTVIEVGDFITPLVPIGLAAGRLGNFINGELWGRITDLPWGMVFPQVDPYPRHPSQLYEFFLEGIVLFCIVWFYAQKPRPPAAISGVFLTSYGVFRLICESFRQPDPQLGFIAFGWLTMGELLSIPVLVFGLLMLGHAYYNSLRNRSGGASTW